MLVSFPKVPKASNSKSPENRRFRLPHCCCCCCQKLQSLGYIFASDSMGLSSLKFSWWSPKASTCTVFQKKFTPITFVI